MKLSELLEMTITGEWGEECEGINGVRVLRTTNFTNIGVLSFDKVVVRNIPKEKVLKKQLKKGDIIVEKSGGTKETPVGRVVYFESNEEYLCNNFTQVLRANEELVNPKYLFYCLFAYYQFRVTEKLYNKTTGIQNLQMGRYLELPIPVVERDKQDKVCRELDQLFDLIAKRKEEISLLDDLVKSQFIEMFEGKFDTLKIGEVFRTTSGGTPSKSRLEYYKNGTIPWLSSGEVNKGIIYTVKNYITQEGVDNSSAKMVPENSVVIAMYGATAGQVGLLRIPTTTNQAVCSVLPDSRYIPEYLYYAIKSKKDWMISQCAGGAQPNISQGVIKRMEIVNAPYELQKEFAAFVEQTDKSKNVFEMEVAA